MSDTYTNPAGTIAVQRSEFVPQCSPQTQAACDMWCFTLMVMRLILNLQRVGCCVSFYLVHDCTNAIWLRLQINKCTVQEEDIKREHTNSRNQSWGNKQKSRSLKTRICIKMLWLFACVVVRWPVLFPCLVWSACWDFLSRLNRTEQVEDDSLVCCTQQPLLSEWKEIYFIWNQITKRIFYLILGALGYSHLSVRNEATISLKCCGTTIVGFLGFIFLIC